MANDDAHWVRSILAGAGLVAGSPIEPGDPVTVDAAGCVHAVPRRHEYNQRRDTFECWVCGADYRNPDPDPCPGPKEGG